MQGSFSSENPTRSTPVSLGQNHGYRFEGDRAILNAELAWVPSRVPSRDEDAAGRDEHWALQLWACEHPYQGGPLRGIKVAEAALQLPDAQQLPSDGDVERLEAEAFAQLPPTQREYAMVLVLASGTRGTYDQVHDFSNYAARQQFAAPHLDGSVGYRIEHDEVVLQAEGIRNPRAEDNLSGSLALELWALVEPYVGGAFTGSRLAAVDLDRLAGQRELRSLEQRTWLTEAPAGTWHVALMLREWTAGAGYITRDFCNFSAPHVVAAPPEEDAHVAASPVREEALEEPSSTPVETWQDATSSVGHEELAAASLRSEPNVAPAMEVTRSDVHAAAPMPVERAEAPTQPTRVAQPAAPVVKNALQAGSKPAVPAAPGAVQVPSETAAKASLAHAVTKLAPVASTPMRVSVQTASTDDLARVPGLNKKLAAAIVRARPFGSLDELRRVRGIGDKMLQQLRSTLTV